MLSLNQKIKPYNKTLANMKKEDKENWGQKVYEQLTEKFDLANTKFVILAGKNYIEPLEKYINIENPIPEGNRKLGKRLSWLDEHIKC